MIDAATRNTLVDLLQRERCSLLMYVSEAFPLTTPAEQKALDDILAMVKEEEHAAIRRGKANKIACCLQDRCEAGAFFFNDPLLAQTLQLALQFGASQEPRDKRGASQRSSAQQKAKPIGLPKKGLNRERESNALLIPNTVIIGSYDFQ